MSHLVAHVSKRRTRLDKLASEAAPEVMKSYFPEAASRDERLENALIEIVHLDWRAGVRGKHELIANIMLAFRKARDNSFISEHQERSPQFAAHVYPPRPVLPLWRPQSSPDSIDGSRSASVERICKLL